MFKRRDSHRPSSDLIASFNKSFPSLPGLLQQRLDGRVQPELPLTPQRFGSDESLDLMSFDPRHFPSYDDHPEETTTPGGTNYRPSTSQAPATSSFNYGSYLDFPTPTPWQQSPGSTGFYAQSQMQMQYSWPASMQPGGLQTPFSRSLSVPSSIHTHQPAYLSLQDVQLQPSYHPNAIDFPSAYQPFSPQEASHPQFKYGHDAMQAAQSGQALPSQRRSRAATNAQSFGSSEFRFHVSLINGTAMVKDNEIPVSYLNKRQAYKIKIRDTRPESSGAVPTTYRTFIRVSFHEDKQRARPDQHWQLWKDGRGMNEAQQHGGKLQAIEYVSSPQPPGQAADVHVEKEFFDGFCITWTAPHSYPPECEVQFRCNFLSTDFSRSKGVKGIPVRLCAKSEVVAFPHMGPPMMQPEICYCKIKLFRDHGAERKLTNDEAAIRRLLSKTEEQMRQTQPDEEDEYKHFDASGKRRASDYSPKATRPSKIARHKRSGSVSSEASFQADEGLEGDLPVKVASLNKLLRSKQDITIFFLRGEEGDDPDLHPVSLLDSSMPASASDSPEIARVERRNTQMTESSAQSARSPEVSTYPVSPNFRGLQLPTPLTSQHPSTDSQVTMKQESNADSTTSNVQHLASPARRAADEKQATLTTKAGASIQAVDLDPEYNPPPEPLVKPVACFYVQLKPIDASTAPDSYRAIYLYERSSASLTYAVAQKQDINPDDVVSTVYINKNDRRGIRVLVDDDFVTHIAEGQDMIAELSTHSASSSQQQQQQKGSSRRAQGAARYTLTLSY